MPVYTFDFGINETDSTQVTEALSGENFDLFLAAKHLFPRRTFDLKGTAPNAASINGINQLIKRDDSDTTLVFEAVPPTYYLWDGATFTSVRTTSLDTDSMFRDTHWPLDDTLVITDLARLTPLLSWDGVTLSRHNTGLASGSPLTNTGITEAVGVYTVTTPGHAYAIGDTVIISGSDIHDGEYEVIATTGTTWDFTAVPGLGASATHGASDKTVDVYAKYSVVHNGRLWLFNVLTDADNPHMILASAFEDPESFDTVNRSGVATGNAAFYTLTADLKPINGVAVFNRQIIISTVDGALHRLSGVDAADYQFVTYFMGSAAQGNESMVNIGNDVIYVRRGGNIDLLSSTDTAGDVRADDVSRWIPETVKDLSDSITVYDEGNQKVLFIVGNQALVLFKDILATGGGSPWSFYRTELPDVFNTRAVRYLRRPGEKTWTLYLGSRDGNIYDLNGAGSGDSGTAITVSRRSQIIEYDKRLIMMGKINYRRLAEIPCSLIFEWSDEYNTTQCDFILKGAPAGAAIPAYYNSESYYNSGTDFYNEGFSFLDRVSHQNFAPAGRANSFTMTFTATTLGAFHIDNLMLSE